MSFKVIRPQIKTLMESISKIQEVKGYPTLKFNGFPACYIIPSDNSNDYETTTENVRTYSFIVRVFYSTKDVTVEQSILALEDLIDDVIDAIDQEDLKGSDIRTIGVNLPSKYTYLNVWATPSDWGEIPEENLLMAEITVRVRVSVDIL